MMWFALPVLWHQDPELMFINWSTIFNCEHHLLAAAYLCVLSLALSPYLFLSLLILPWQWERLRVGGEGDDRGWDGWMASLTPWTWVWVNSGSWWWTGRPGVLHFMGSQRVGHDWATELNWKLWVLVLILLFVDFSITDVISTVNRFKMYSIQVSI